MRLVALSFQHSLFNVRKIFFLGGEVEFREVFSFKVVQTIVFDLKQLFNSSKSP